MIIPKRAIKDFLDRPRADFRSWKNLTDAQIEQKRAALPIQPPIWKKFRKHQRICFLIGAHAKKFLCLNDTGTGKSLLALGLVWYFKRLRRIRHVLILVPNKINKAEWALEIQKHVPSLPYSVLEGSSQDKWEEIRTTSSLVYIETYDGFLRLACKLVPRKKKPGDRLVPDERALRELRKKFQGLVLDEATEIKNYQALPFRICRQLAKSCQIILPMTGTPFGRNPQDLWAQMFLVDGGETLGQTLGLFRSAFFKSKLVQFGGEEYTFDKTKEKLLHRFLAHRSIRYPANQADLPRVTRIIKKVNLPEDAQMYYERARQAIIAAGGNYREMRNAFLRMRQISSGFVGYYDDDLGEKAQFEFEENPKLDMLISILTSLSEDAKAIVFHEYNYSGKRICDALTKVSIPHLYLYGKTKNAQSVREQFERNPNYRVLVLSNAAGWAGINLQVANYGLYYESPVSVIMRRQTRARFVRQESAHQRVFLYDLVTKDTLDEKILLFHKQGQSLFDALVEGRISLAG